MLPLKKSGRYPKITICISLSQNSWISEFMKSALRERFPMFKKHHPVVDDFEVRCSTEHERHLWCFNSIPQSSQSLLQWLIQQPQRWKQNVAKNQTKPDDSPSSEWPLQIHARPPLRAKKPRFSWQWFLRWCENDFHPASMNFRSSTVLEMNVSREKEGKWTKRSYRCTSQSSKVLKSFVVRLFFSPRNH